MRKMDNDEATIRIKTFFLWKRIKNILYIIATTNESGFMQPT